MRVDLVKTQTSGLDAGDDVPPSLLTASVLANSLVTNSPATTSYRLKPCPNSTTVLIGRNGRGQWIARERHGLYGGLFVSREKAVRYALFENGHRPDAIIMVAGIVELDMTNAPAPDAPDFNAMPAQARAA